MLAFSGVLWSISRLLFVVAVGYAALGSLCAVVLGRPLVRLNYDQADREANFRNELVHVRQNAESVVLLHREAHFEARLHRHVGALRRQPQADHRRESQPQLLHDGLQLPDPDHPGAHRRVRSSSAARSSSASSRRPPWRSPTSLGAFSLVVNQFPSISSYAAVLARLSALVETAETIAARGAGGIAVAEDDEPGSPSRG